MMRQVLACALILSAGCGSDSDGSEPGADAAPTSEYSRLIGGTWSLAPGQADTYRCVRYTVPEDTYITSIKADSPIGTHHTVLSISSSRTAGPDGEYDCTVSELGTVMLYASGVGTEPLDFPTDVGVKVAAGTQIHLNLHLYNATDEALADQSSLFVKASSTPPPVLAEMAFAGSFLFEIPANGQPYTKTGGCTAANDQKLFALWPHMHKSAVHTKFELTHAGTKTTLLDQAYSFEEQKYWMQTPEIQLAAGDKIDVTCTWVNNTGTKIRFGDSSDTEMCFTGMYRYPAEQTNNLFQCTDTGGTGF